MKGSVYITASYMITALGEGVKANIDAIFRGQTGVRLVSKPEMYKTPVMIGLIDDSIYSSLRSDYGTLYTKSELLAIDCISKALTGVPQCDGRTGLVIASAKGNIDFIEKHCQCGPYVPESDEPVLFGGMSRRIGEFHGIKEEDIYLISNACISGVSAIVAARRMILSGKYDRVIVVGVDVQNKFIISGFASFKSLSQELCRPYDISRCGLNLGEACGAIILDKKSFAGSVAIIGGAISDDANHISGPSRTGDGLYFSIKGAMDEGGVSADMIDMLQMHGTATIYNDEMESKAAALVGLQNVPVQSLKPYFGHTMGASGVIETIIAAEELKTGILAGTRGFSELGVPMSLNVSASNKSISGAEYFIKTASGFGGTNAAVLLSLNHDVPVQSNIPLMKVVRRLEIASGKVNVDSKVVYEDVHADDFSDFIRNAYKFRGENNMKFYKMDDLSKLAYMASEWLFDGICYEETECAIVMSGKYGSLDSDMKHQHIIDSEGADAASPAIFVYTLPNVAAGEISIRHHIKGENTWFYSADVSMSDIREYSALVSASAHLKYCIVAHIDYIAGEYSAIFELLAPEYPLAKLD